jgi:hypothetical protein
MSKFLSIKKKRIFAISVSITFINKIIKAIFFFLLAFLRSTSKDDTGTDVDEGNDVISCVIDNTPINIDAKTIAPFKCVISSAGQLHEDNQTAVIAIYGCSLPDHRLREYRYIMDQLF